MKHPHAPRCRARIALGAIAIAVASLALAGPGLSRACAADGLEVGAAKVDITPTDLAELNPMGGSFIAVHDPIFLRALVLAEGSERIAIVSVDLIEVGDMAPIRQRIEREVGIPFDHILIAATHDHSAPRLGDVSPGALAHAGGPASAAYTAAVYDRMVAALKRSVATMRPASVGSGAGTADVNVDRDLYVPGRGWTLGYDPDGPSDKALRVLKFVDREGRPIAVLMNYGVHSTVTLGWNRVSGDLAGAAERTVESGLGLDAVALWTLGAVGDQAPRIAPGPPRGSSHGADAPPSSGPPGGNGGTTAYAAADAQGLMVGAEALRVARGITATDASPRLLAEETVVSCPVKAGQDVMADMKQGAVSRVDLRLGLFEIGPVALAAVSGEVVTAIERRLQVASPLKDTILVSIANDRIGYVPDDASYDRQTFEVKGSPVQPGCAEPAIVGGFASRIAAHLR